jgi:hypothetical protein
MFNRILIVILFVFSASAVCAAVPNGYIFYFDAKEVNGTGQAQPADGAFITQWVDISTGIVAVASSGENPRFDLTAINGKPGVKFGPVGGSSEGVFKVPSSASINLDNSVYNKKTFAMVFKTSSDINTLQFLYEQGGRVNGYNIMIKNGELWFGIWRKSSTPQNNAVSLGAVSANTIYQIVAVQDSPASEVRVYLDGSLKGTGTLPEGIVRHTGNVYLGGNDPTIDVSQSGITGTIDNGIDFFFKGHIGEFYSWNDSISTAEVEDITDHFNEQWEPVDIIISQSVAVIDDFISTSNDKAISGSVMEYTLLVTSQGLGIPIEDTISVSLEIDESKYSFYSDSDFATSPISIQDTAGSTGISFDYVSINDPNDGFSVYDNADQLIANPSIVNGTLTGISRVQLDFTGLMPASSGGVDPQFEIRYKIKLL